MLESEQIIEYVGIRAGIPTYVHRDETNESNEYTIYDEEIGYLVSNKAENDIEVFDSFTQACNYAIVQVNKNRLLIEKRNKQLKEIKLDIQGYMQEQPQHFLHITTRLRNKSKVTRQTRGDQKIKKVSINHNSKLDSFRYLVGLAIIILPLAIPFAVLLSLAI